MVILAVHNALKGFDGVGQFDVFAGVPRKLFRRGERLREELLDSAGTGHGFFVFVGQFVHTQDSNNILQIFVFL